MESIRKRCKPFHSDSSNIPVAIHLETRYNHAISKSFIALAWSSEVLTGAMFFLSLPAYAESLYSEAIMKRPTFTLSDIIIPFDIDRGDLKPADVIGR